jgi:hypothetical protein
VTSYVTILRNVTNILNTTEMVNSYSDGVKSMRKQLFSVKNKQVTEVIAKQYVFKLSKIAQQRKHPLVDIWANLSFWGKRKRSSRVEQLYSALKQTHPGEVSFLLRLMSPTRR